MRHRLRRTALISLLLACTAPLAGAAAVAPAGAAPRAAQLVARPAAARAGETLTLEGRGFASDARIVLLAGPLGHTPTRIGRAVAGQRGRFVATIRIRANASAHAFVAVACQDGCRVKASARFRIVVR